MIITGYLLVAILGKTVKLEDETIYDTAGQCYARQNAFPPTLGDKTKFVCMKMQARGVKINVTEISE